MERYLREWRKEALNKNQHDAAIFIGDKLLALTSESEYSDQDAWWLAQVHFSTGNYSRAYSFLSRSDLSSRNPNCKYLASLCLIRQSKYDDALRLLGDRNPLHLAKDPDSARKKYAHIDVRNGKSKDLNGSSKTNRIDRSVDRELEPTFNIKAEGGMCYLRGLCYAKQNAYDRAKQCFKDAVQIDVQCFEAFDALMKNSLMSPKEEWEFLESLDFDTIQVGDGSDPSLSQEAAAFTKMLYTTRMSKYSHPQEVTTATETLSTHYHLADNPDILLSKASLLFTQCQFRDALNLTTSILATDPHNFPCMPIHLACLYELGEKNTLYLLSHNLADSHPDEPCTYLAIGVYYLAINQIAQARRFFSKASILDPHFGPAWIGFAHTFAAEGEHDQAIAAYSTAARLFQGTHLPSLFLGMQNLQLNNHKLAREYLNVSWNLCDTDPLLLNELGVAFYHEDRLEDAINVFQQALEIANNIDSDPKAWNPTHTNLGHAYRRVGRYEEALAEFDEVLRQAGKDAAIFSAKGLTLLEMGDTRGATVALHEALSVSPQDPIATDLLARAMDAFEDEGILGAGEEDEVDRRLGEMVGVVAGRTRARTRRIRGRVRGDGGNDGGDYAEGEDSMALDDEDASQV